MICLTFTNNYLKIKMKQNYRLISLKLSFLNKKTLKIKDFLPPKYGNLEFILVRKFNYSNTP